MKQKGGPVTLSQRANNRSKQEHCSACDEATLELGGLIAAHLKTTVNKTIVSHAYLLQ